MTKKNIFPTIYLVWGSILLILPIVSIASYYAVLNRYGSVPFNDRLYEMARTTGKTIPVFPEDWGFVMIIGYFSHVYLIPFALVINFAMYRYHPHYRVPWKHYCAVVFIWLLTWLLMSTEFGGWYINFVLD